VFTTDGFRCDRSVLPGIKRCAYHKPPKVTIDEKPFLTTPSADVLREIEKEGFDYLTYKNLGQSPCACCGRLFPMVGSDAQLNEFEKLPLESNANLLRADGDKYRNVIAADPSAFMYDGARKTQYNGLILERGGIQDDGRVSLCTECFTDLSGSKMPKFALANGQYVGRMPPELKQLTFAERHVIARVRSNNPIIKLSTGISQRALSGHFLFRMQKPTDLLSHLPVAVDDASAQIQVVLVKTMERCGPCTALPSRSPTCPCNDVLHLLRQYKSILRVRPTAVRNAIMWLQKFNPAWQDVTINDAALQSYSTDANDGTALFQRLQDDAIIIKDNQKNDQRAEINGVVSVHREAIVIK
jgi:hypothetical protein